MVSSSDLSENPDWTAAITERKIQDAIDEGLFDNLPGAGQPLDLSVNPFEAPGMGAINRLLKHNRVLPPWLLLEKEIEAVRELALACLRQWEAEEADLRETAHYAARRAAARDLYHCRMKIVNDLILKYNQSNPFAHRTPMPFMIRRRLANFDAMYGSPE